MNNAYWQPSFSFSEIDGFIPELKKSKTANGNDNNIKPQDRAFHEWYRFVLSFPPHLVRNYLQLFDLTPNSVVLDPFCGTGTTLVEARLNGISAIGLEANPFPHFASTIKVSWDVDPDRLLAIATKVAESTYASLLCQGIDDRSLIYSQNGVELRSLPPQASQIMITDSISALPLHKTLVLLDQLHHFRQEPEYQHCVLALGKALITTIGNLRFGPEVGIGAIKKDAPVVAAWMKEIRKIVADLRLVNGQIYPKADVYRADSRLVGQLIRPNSIDAVITSPPYPNEKDYTRTTRLESVILGFITDSVNLRDFKKTLLRSNTRGVYKTDDDDQWVTNIPEIQHLAQQIEERRIELGKTSGFEKLYGRVTRLYFGGMAHHLYELTHVLKPNARLAYVVGDQASYLQVMIRTGQLLANIAERIGYTVEDIDLFRTRFATATQNELREEVIILKWSGEKLAVDLSQTHHL
jgi:SAM-dependent methyltransferase